MFSTRLDVSDDDEESGLTRVVTPRNSVRAFVRLRAREPGPPWCRKEEGAKGSPVATGWWWWWWWKASAFRNHLNWLGPRYSSRVAGDLRRSGQFRVFDGPNGRARYGARRKTARATSCAAMPLNAANTVKASRRSCCNRENRASFVDLLSAWEFSTECRERDTVSRAFVKLVTIYPQVLHFESSRFSRLYSPFHFANEVRCSFRKIKFTLWPIEFL